jgi:8-oxo-dGTP pyrophosphatase MutT (NUDIX family)
MIRVRQLSGDDEEGAARAIGRLLGKIKLQEADDASEPQQKSLIAAGLAVVARDSGRALMLRRADTGAWEFPGGHIDHGETPRRAARREWAEETGLVLPSGEDSRGWEGTNGVYAGYVHSVAHEFPLNGRDMSANPDGDDFEELAWVHPRDIAARAVRNELRTDLPRVREAITGKSAVWVFRKSFKHVPTAAIDLDGTLLEPADPPDFGAVRYGAAEALSELAAKGWRIIIWTVRGNTQAVGDYLDVQGIPWDYINENPDQPPDGSGKVIADVYVDDRAVDGQQEWPNILDEIIGMAVAASEPAPQAKGWKKPDAFAEALRESGFNDYFVQQLLEPEILSEGELRVRLRRADADQRTIDAVAAKFTQLVQKSDRSRDMLNFYVANHKRERQPNNFSCGATEFAAACMYRGVQMLISDAEKLLGTCVETSTNPLRMVEEFHKLGIRAEFIEHMTLEQLSAELEAGNPVIVNLEDYGERREPGAAFLYGHYNTALKRMDSITLFHDPSIENVEEGSENTATPGLVPYTDEDFLRVWWDTRELIGEKEGKLIRSSIVVGTRDVPQVRKAAGAQCEQGETSAKTGCTSASGETAKRKPPGSQFSQKIKDKLRAFGMVGTFPPADVPIHDVKVADLSAGMEALKYSPLMSWSQQTKSGRISRQYRYTEAFHQRNAEEKFARVKELEPVAEQIAETLTNRMRDNALPEKTREAAAIASIIAETGLRPTDGADSVKHGHFGISSLQARHARIAGDSVELDFVGKEGVRNRTTVRDPINVLFLKHQLTKYKSEQQLFPSADSDDAGIELKRASTEAGGPADVKLKDLRTLKACNTARSAVRDFQGPPPPLTGNRAKDIKLMAKAVLAVSGTVAAVLNNTPTQSRDNYVMPQIWREWQEKFQL